jgi:hypothetical protein
MKKAILAMVVSALLAPAGLSAQTPDPTAPIRQFIDGFNKGDTKSAFAAYSEGNIAIIDEFAPNRWLGPNAAHGWADDFQKQAEAKGITDPVVKYGKPKRTEVEGDYAYVIIPAVYTFKQKGKPLVEEGQMTFALHLESGAWKIAAWTWSGLKPHAPKPKL